MHRQYHLSSRVFELLLLLSALLLSSTVEAQRDKSSSTLKVVATVGMLADALQEIGGDRFVVHTLIGAGGDPHLYKASPQDVVAIAQADIVVAVGLHLEGKMQDILERYRAKDKVIFVGEGLKRERLLPAAPGMLPEDIEGQAWDPHVWMDIELWSDAIEFLSDSLQTKDSEYRDQYRGNTAVYRKKMQDLHLEVKKNIASIPPEKRVLVTAHDAFHYFGRAYNIEVRGIQGISTESEAGLRDINALVDFLVSRQIPAVFVESSVSQKNVFALIEGAKSKGHTVEIGGELFSDSMGRVGSPEGTYLGMIHHNTKTISAALNRSTPPAAQKSPVIDGGS